MLIHILPEKIVSLQCVSVGSFSPLCSRTGAFRVGKHVAFQMRITWKCWSTHFTRKWFLSSMGLHVAFQKGISGRMLIHTLHRKMVSLHCVKLDGILSRNCLKMMIHKVHKNKVSLLCVCAYGVLMYNSVKMQIHTLYKNMVSLQCVIACGFSKVN